MCFQHTEIRQVSHRQKQIRQSRRNVVTFECAGKAKPRHLGQRQIELIGFAKLLPDIGVGEIRGQMLPKM